MILLAGTARKLNKKKRENTELGPTTGEKKKKKVRTTNSRREGTVLPMFLGGGCCGELWGAIRVTKSL